MMFKRQSMSAMGPDPVALFAAVARLPVYSAESPVFVEVNDNDGIDPAANWLDEALARVRTGEIYGVWQQRYGGPALKVSHFGVVYVGYPTLLDVEAAINLAQRLPLWVLVLASRWRWEELPATSTFGDGNQSHGWAVIFKGDGHDRLVSRRWLEHGPWLLRREPDDVSYIQFHDLAAPEDVAYQQARWAHDRMGVDDMGAYLHPEHGYRTEVRGLYKPAERSLTITRGNGQGLTQREMLDLCAYRRDKRSDTAEPIERVRIAYLEARDARRDLHELWLRELECWCFDAEGREVRLDGAYTPERIAPEWVERVEGLTPHAGPTRAVFAPGLSRLLHAPDDALPGGWCRDDLLFHITDHHNPGGGYEVREVLSADVPRVTASSGESGDLVVTAAQGVGGAMQRDAAEPLLARWRAAPSAAPVSIDPLRLGVTLPAIIVPDPYRDQRPINLGPDHPLNGVVVHGAGEIRRRVRAHNREDLRDVEALLDLCVKGRFVLSVTAPDAGAR